MECTLEYIVLRLKRADTPLFRTARKMVDIGRTATLPVPRALRPAGRFLYGLHFYLPMLWNRLKSAFFTTPIFTCRCESVGRHLQLSALPNVQGHTRIHLGDDVRLSGSLAVVSGKFHDRPTLRIGNRAFIGHNVSITCNREVTIEDDVLIAAACKISDYDGHPASLEQRISDGLPSEHDIQPVRICKGAWIGYGVMILKGVTVGAGGVVGAHSVVTRDVPPYCVVAGSPARIVKCAEAETASSLKAVSAAA
ncbi:MAG TPA: acyltransferase [Candidatus Sulfotelmatobacter sp.]|nr:acyltransferase [Candidatus Sulfotelmatobacter sp.]